MWFIKDPHDPTFQPVRDLMERTVLAQIRKLAISGVIYICFVAVSIRSLYYGMAALSFGSVSFLPLRWNMRYVFQSRLCAILANRKRRIPLSVTSFDLIFVHVFGPLILRYAKPRRLARRIASVVFARLAKTLRLSSYLLGGDHLAERSHFRSWNGQINPTEQGGYRRVPNNDSVPIIRGRRMHIETDVDGQALTAEGEKRMKAQDAESIKSKRDVKKDYVVVYVPPNFYTRVVLFTLGVVMAGVVTLFFCTTVPITLGRIAFTRITQEHVHDGYALIVGLVVCWGCFTVARSIDMALKYRDPPEPKAPPRNRAPLAIYLIKRGSVWVSKFTWLYLLLGIMVPMLVGSVMHFYFVIPLSVATVRDFKPTINLVQVWAEGMLYLKFFLKALKSARGNRNPRRPDGPDLVALIEPVSFHVSFDVSIAD
jgi:E3 ubiquitin-protein ligase MARCH6